MVRDEGRTCSVKVVSAVQIAGRHGRMLIDDAAGRPGHATADLLARELKRNAQSGYAIVAKCSASLQTDLQVMRSYLPSPLHQWRTAAQMLIIFQAAFKCSSKG